MQKVNVKSKYMSGSWLLVSSVEELTKYMENTSNKVSKLLCELIKSNIPVDRWDHCITKDSAGSILMGTLLHCQFKGESPVLSVDKVMLEKFSNMLKYILDGEKVLINSLGGYCTAPDDATFTFEEEVDLSFKPTYVINDNTKYINLENDSELEEHSKKYLNDKDNNYSYITNLSSHSKEQLEAIFKEFVSKGGTTVYVFTTGLKVQQMYEYFNAAKVSGLVNFEFEFNSDITTGISDFISFAKENANVTCNF